MEIAAIIAMNNKRVIGDEGSIPWHAPHDLKRFKALTENCPVIMGRHTWESLPVKPLKNRLCIVVSRFYTIDVEGVKTCQSVNQAIQVAANSSPSTVWIIGGAKLFDVALPRIQRVELTLVNNDQDGDTILPEFEFQFKEISREIVDSDPKLSFISYIRK